MLALIAMENQLDVVSARVDDMRVYGVVGSRLPCPPGIDAKALGCRRSHQRALEDFLSGDEERLVVIEYDADLTSAALRQIIEDESHALIVYDSWAHESIPPRTHCYSCNRDAAYMLYNESSRFPWTDFSYAMYVTLQRTDSRLVPSVGQRQ